MRTPKLVETAVVSSAALPDFASELMVLILDGIEEGAMLCVSKALE